MATTNGLPPELIVRLMSREDIPAVIDLQLRAFPGLPPWRTDQLQRHLEVFPEGQLVVADPVGRILGSASSLLIDWDDYAESANWSGGARSYRNLRRHPRALRLRAQRP